MFPQRWPDFGLRRHGRGRATTNSSGYYLAPSLSAVIDIATDPRSDGVALTATVN
nr:hypothetical protein [uncultured Tolumonas sp.]